MEVFQKCSETSARSLSQLKTDLEEYDFPYDLRKKNIIWKTDLAEKRKIYLRFARKQIIYDCLLKNILITPETTTRVQYHDCTVFQTWSGAAVGSCEGLGSNFIALKNGYITALLYKSRNIRTQILLHEKPIRTINILFY